MTQLLEKPEANATEATASLYDRHYRRIRGYCLGQLRDCEEANDAVQSTFLYAFASLQRGVAPRNELPWLFTIAHNVCRTRRRSLRRRSRLESGVDLDTLSESVGRDDPSCDELEGLGTALAAMPENQRRALLLREWQGLSYAEVAERMGLTESAVEAVLFRARRNLAQKLRPLDRAASFVSALLLLPGLRRLGSLTGTAKAATATLAVGLVAGTAVQPFIHPRRHTSPPPRAAVQPAGAVPQRAVVTAAAATPRAVRVLHPTPKGVARSAVAQKEATPAPVQVSTPAAVPAHSSFQPSPDPAPTAPTEPDSAPSSDPPPPDRGTTREPAPVVAARPAPAAAPDVRDVLPPQVQSMLPDVPLPPPAAAIDANLPDLPAAVNSVTDTLPNVPLPVPTTDTAPQLPNVSVPQLPSVPPVPLPESPTKGTPLQASQ